MSPRDYQLSSKLSKTSDDVTLWSNDRGKVEIAADTLAVEVVRDGRPCGYIFHGRGRLLLDAIVETERGAVGEPVERVLDEPFLMLGRLEGEQQHLKDPGPEDFRKWGYENQNEFVARAEKLRDTFFDGSTCRHSRPERLRENGTCVFAFPNNQDQLDILLAEDSNLVYTATDRVFVKKGDKMVLTSRGCVAVAKPGKSVLVEGNCCSHIHQHRHDSW